MDLELRNAIRPITASNHAWAGQVLAGVLTAVVLCTAGVAGEVPQVQDIQVAQSDLDQPGPDNRLHRENAVKFLLSSEALEAHMILKNRLVAGDDSEKVSLFILSELRSRVSNRNDPVFGLGAGDAGRALIRSYVPSLVSAFIESAPDPQQYAALRGPALECLREMPPLERSEGLESMVRGGGIQDLEMRKAALRAAADCRDIGLARVIAIPFGESANNLPPNPQLLPTARQALEELTFQVFRDEGAFNVWWEANEHRTYLDIVAAKAKQTHAREAELQNELIQKTVELVEALVGQRDVKWRRIHDLVVNDNPPGVGLSSLQKLREILAGNPHEGNSSEQRLEFHRALVQQLEQATEDNEKALLLETAAYLIRPQESTERAAIEARLIEHLQSPNAVLRLAALHGLRRFPSATNRAAVVRVASDALDGQEEETLRTALETLHGNANWRAPAPGDEDSSEWLRVLRQVFGQFDSVEILGEALEVALLEDSEGAQVPEVFDVLLELIAGQKDSNLRLDVLVQLRPAGTSADNADRFVAALLGRLDDESSQIRQQAAKMLSNLPTGTAEQRLEWDEQVQQKLRERLLEEPDPDVFEALMTGLSELGQRGTQENVISIFKETIEGLPESSVDHRQVVIEKLTNLGLDSGLEVGLWQRIAEILLEQRQREEARSILLNQKSGELASRDDVSEDQIRDGLNLLIRAALLKPAGDPAYSEEEARQVLDAFDDLEARNVSMNEADSQLLRLELYNVLANHAALIHHGSTYLKADPQTLSADQQNQVTILMARAALGQNDPKEAWLTINRLDDLGKESPEALRTCEEIAKALMLTGPDPDKANLAVVILTHVVDHTHEDAAPFRERFLDLAHARLTASTTSRTEVKKMLQEKAALFDSADCPQQLYQRYQDLLARTGN